MDKQGSWLQPFIGVQMPSQLRGENIFYKKDHLPKHYAIKAG